MSTHQNASLMLHKLNLGLVRKAEVELQRELAISYSQFLILAAAAHAKAASQCHVARFLNITEAAVSRQVETLVDKGWLLRTPNPANRREHILVLTPAGVTIATKARGLVAGLHHHEFAVLTAAERGELDRILVKLLDAVCPNISQSVTKGEKQHAKA
jgi:MarR family multiple antibiotic resistance transcriptional regulator